MADMQKCTDIKVVKIDKLYDQLVLGSEKKERVRFLA